MVQKASILNGQRLERAPKNYDVTKFIHVPIKALNYNAQGKVQKPQLNNTFGSEANFPWSYET